MLDGRSRYIPVRAAAVAHGGRAVLIAGGHRTGKSTLAASLVRRGWGYISDAVSLIDVAGRPELRPYWRPFTSAGLTPIPASELGALAGPTPLAAIVIPRQPDDPGAAERVSPAAVLGPLTAHLPLLEDARSGFHQLVSVASTVPSWELSFTDDDCGRRRRRDRRRCGVSGPAPHEAIDTVFLEPEVVLFDGRDASVVRLNPSASAVWLLLDGATSPAVIAAELAEIVGLPADVLAPDVEAAVADFAAQGLLAGTARAADEDDVPAVEDVDGPFVLPRPPDP